MTPTIRARLALVLSFSVSFIFALALSMPTQALAKEPVLKIGSKRFTESYVLGEILAQTAAPHAAVRHQQGLGNTAIVLAALRAGSIDVYPEYLGTLEREILKHQSAVPLARMQQELAAMGLGVAVPLGFNNSYALALRGHASADLRSLSELARHPTLRLGLSHEFLGRTDGWPGLARHYQLPQKPSGLDHGLAYEALLSGQIDVMDVYATDAKIGKLQLRVLHDDAGYFPRYDAVLLYRLDLPGRFPKAWAAIEALEGKIDNPRMIALNAAVELEGQTFAQAAQAFLAAPETPPAPPRDASTPVASTQASASPTASSADATSPFIHSVTRFFADKLLGADFWRLTREHVLLVALGLGLAAALGIPLGMLAARVAALRRPVLALVGVLQTIPTLALLAMLIALLGQIGSIPALGALFLYALLPIVQTTCTGLLQVPQGLGMAALALGLSERDRLFLIDAPLAWPFMLAGLKTAAVMSVGTATLAAFVGAGGYGERISIGLALNDNAMLLAGALPAAALALLTQGLFEWLERRSLKGR
jgi:osmoprotectant transport system permease protein